MVTICFEFFMWGNNWAAKVEMWSLLCSGWALLFQSLVTKGRLSSIHIQACRHSLRLESGGCCWFLEVGFEVSATDICATSSTVSAGLIWPFIKYPTILSSGHTTTVHWHSTFSWYILLASLSFCYLDEKLQGEFIGQWHNYYPKITLICPIPLFLLFIWIMMGGSCMFVKHLVETLRNGIDETFAWDLLIKNVHYFEDTLITFIWRPFAHQSVSLEALGSNSLMKWIASCTDVVIHCLISHHYLDFCILPEGQLFFH